MYPKKRTKCIVQLTLHIPNAIQLFTCIFLHFQASSKIFHSALKSIQSKVEAVVNIKYEDDDVVEIVNGTAQ